MTSTMAELKYPSTPPLFLVGTSGKGVRYLQFLAQHLPADVPAAFFFLLHRVRASELQRPILDMLKFHSQLDVCVPHTGQSIQSATIYLAPVDQHMTLVEQRIVIADEPSDGKWRPSIDALLISGAQSYQANVVSVLLSGRLEDGVEGLRETTRQGGITVAQSPEDAYDPILPLNALLKDHPNYVLPLQDMPALFCELAGFSHFPHQKKVAEQAAQAAVRQRKEVRES